MLYRPQNEEGQGLVEYALILVLVAVVVIVILTLLGPVIGNVFSNIVTRASRASRLITSSFRTQQSGSFGSRFLFPSVPPRDARHRNRLSLPHNHRVLELCADGAVNRVERPTVARRADLPAP
jgi:pilus assembly protein Flp/PilA